MSDDDKPKGSAPGEENAGAADPASGKKSMSPDTENPEAAGADDAKGATGADTGAQPGADAGAQAGADAGAQAGADAGAQAGADAGAQAGADAGAQAGAAAGTTTGQASVADLTNTGHAAQATAADVGAAAGAAAGADAGAVAGAAAGADAGAAVKTKIALENATETSPKSDVQKSGDVMSGLQRAGVDLAKWVLTIISAAIVLLIVLVASSELLKNTETAPVHKLILDIHAKTLQLPADDPKVPQARKDFQELSRQIIDAKQAERSFWMQFSQMILLNLLLPVLTAILGYVFGANANRG